jgi:hypothetical protein
MKVETLRKFAGAVDEINMVMEKYGFLVVDIKDEGNPSWDYLNIRVLPKPETGSIKDNILRGEGF